MQQSKRLFSITLLLIFVSGAVFAQEPTKRSKPQNLTAAAASNPVTGSGSAGQITKWTGVDGANTYTVGNSNITEDKFGKIGIGTTTPSSVLTVRGMIETTLGGYKFPDGTVQTTAGISSVSHDATLTGNGTAASPLGIAAGGVNTTQLANNAVTAAKLADGAVTTAKLTDGAVTTAKLADAAVTNAKIANGTVVRSLNGLTENVTIAGGTNIAISSAGNTITVAAPNALTNVAHDATLTGNGTPASPLSVVQGAGDASQPVQVTLDISLSFTVPDGKRFVIEYVGASVTRPTSGTLQPMDGFELRTRIGSTTVSHILVSYRVSNGVAGFATYFTGQVVKFYADPGTQVKAFPPTDTSSALVTLSGYYVDVP